MNKYAFYPIILIFSTVLASCDGTRERRSESTVSIEDDGARREVNFFSYNENRDYPDAILEMYSPLGNQNFNTTKVPFEFNIKNYPFAEEGQGFQLKLAINGNDPIGYNMPIFQKELNQGTYRAVAYLVNNEGIALKEFGNYVDRDFTVLGSNTFPSTDDPYLVVNMPVNDQVYEQGDEIIVDFMVLDGSPKEDGFSVLIKFNQYEYETDEIIPVRVDDLPSGNYDLEIKLIKADGTEMESLFSSARKRIKIN